MAAVSILCAVNPDAGSSTMAPEVIGVDKKAEWFVLRTHPRHEKCVAERARGRQVESFLPLYRSVRYWKDRRKELELPLFPGYVFVHMALRDRLQVLQLPGVVHFVSFH